MRQVGFANAAESLVMLLPQRVQVPNNHILTQNLYYNYYCPNPKYLIIGYMDPLGSNASHTFQPLVLQGKVCLITAWIGSEQGLQQRVQAKCKILSYVW